MSLVLDLDYSRKLPLKSISLNPIFIDEKVLCKFLNYHYRTSLKELKNNTLKKHKLDTKIILSK